MGGLVIKTVAHCWPLVWYCLVKEYFSTSGSLDLILLPPGNSSPSAFLAQKPDLSLPWEVAVLLTAFHTYVIYYCLLI